MKKYLFIFAVLFSLALSSCNFSSRTNTSDAKNSQWRGENRDGIYNETGLLKEWPAEGPQLLWKYEGLGDGHTSAAIANGKLYITGLTDDDLVLYVLDLKGTLLVKKILGKEWNMSYNGPRSTACVNDGKLYIYNALGTLWCLDETTLNPVWTKDVFTDFDGKNIAWGVTESPLIVGEKLFITPGGVTNNMVALNKNTGALIWSSSGEENASAYCSPLYIGDHSIPMVVTSTADFIVAFNADTGEKLWSHPRTNQWKVHPNTPLYHNGMVFSATGYGEGAVMLRLINGGKGIEEVWKKSELDFQMGGAVRLGNEIYGAAQNGQNLFCVDWNTGEIKHKERELARSNVIFADGMLYCYSDRGEMALVKPNPEKFEIVSSFKVVYGTDQHWAHTVIHEGVLYIRHGDALMAYNIRAKQ